MQITKPRRAGKSQTIGHKAKSVSSKNMQLNLIEIWPVTISCYCKLTKLNTPRTEYCQSEYYYRSHHTIVV
jgi:hypothetical protein